MAYSPFRWQTPFSRLEMAKLRLQVESQRSKELDELDAFSRTPSPFIDRFADVTGPFRGRTAGLRPQTPAAPEVLAREPFAPLAPPLGTLGDEETNRRMREGVFGVLRETGQAFSGTAEDVASGYRSLEKRYIQPAQALATQALRARQTGIPAPTGVGKARITQPSPEQTGERPFVNPIRAGLGDEKEIERAEEVLAELGLGRIAIQGLLDPWNAVPIIGFSKIDDFARGIRTISRLTGPARVRAVAALKESETFQTALRGLREAPEAGARPLGGKAAEEGAETLGGAVPPPREPVSGVALEDDFSKTIQEAIDQMRENRVAVKPAQRAERSQRLAASEDAYQRALQEGKTRVEALRIKRGVQAGQLPRPKGALVELSPEQETIIQSRVDSFDFGRGAGPDFERDRVRSALVKLGIGEPVPENELLSIEKVLGPEFVQELKAAGKRLPSGLWEWAYEIAVVPKAVISAFDMSAVLRQNVMAVPSHPIEAMQSFVPAAKSLLKEDWAQAAQRSLLEDAETITLRDGSSITYSQLYDDTHFLRSLGGGSTESEELWRGSLAEHIPVLGKIVRRSNAAFTVFGNQIRARILKTTVRNWTEGGTVMKKLGLGNIRGQQAPTLEELHALADSLGRFTGRGTFKGAKGMAKGLTDTLQAFLWAPQARVAPLEAGAQMFNFRNPRVAAQATRDVVAFVGTGLTILGLAKLAGASVTLDPNATDFGKIKVGKMHINIWGTAQPLARTISRAISGLRIDPTVGAVPTDRLKTVQDYITSGLAPEWSAIWDIIHNTEFPGRPLFRGSAGEIAKREALNRLTPLVAQDILKAAQEEGMIAGMVSAPASFLGVGVSTYPDAPSAQLRAISQYEGLTPKQSYDVSRFIGVANDKVNELRESYGSDVLDRVPRIELYRHIAEDMGYDEITATAAAALASSTKLREQARNPEWIQFVVEHYDELKETNPDLVNKKWIIDLVNESKKEPVGAR